MENLYTHRRAALAGCAAALLCACAAAPAPEVAPLPARPVYLGVTQVGIGQAIRYIYCEVPACPLPTAKTHVPPTAPPQLAALARSPSPAPSGAAAELEVRFGFNSARVSQDDQRQLAQAVSAHPEAHIEIIARSDYVGASKGKARMAAARAKAMRSIVAEQSPGARVTERRELAAPTRVAEAEQARQRNGTVRFTSP